VLDRRLSLSAEVSLRDEPFGALAYHSGNRRLVFLTHTDVVAVVRSLAAADDDTDLAATLRSCGIDERRWPAFVKAIGDLEASQILRERTAVAC
jgi:putative mycofactocin binding protein MftB